MPVWLPLSVFALAVWAVQRLLSKVALNDLGTRKFYLLSALVTLLTYTPYLLVRPPPAPRLPACSASSSYVSRPPRASWRVSRWR